MSRAGRVAAALAIAIAVLPEMSRYAAERALQTVTSAIHEAYASRERRAVILEAVVPSAATLAASRRDDYRPWLLLGSALLLGGRADEARRAYERSIACEERAETLLDLGRAHAMLDHRPEALGMFVRSAWINAALVEEMPAAAQPLVRQQLAAAESALREGRLLLPPVPVPGP